MSKVCLEEEYNSLLSSEVKHVLQICSRVANKYKFPLYLIGGIVRDLIMNKQIYDIDLLVEGNAILFAKKLEGCGVCKIIQLQNNLKTAKVLFENLLEVDIASTRCEVYDNPGELPVVKEISCSLSEDVVRRDFTINSMALSLNKDNMFELIDYLNGYKDIEKKELNVLHEKSFLDDPSRIVRGLKFSLRFGFELGNDTKKLQEDYLSCHNNVMPLERVKNEFKQLFLLNNPEAFDRVISEKIYKLISSKPFPDVDGTKIKSTLYKFDILSDDIWLIYLGILVFNEDEQTFARLNLSGKEKRIIVEAKQLYDNRAVEKSDDYKIYKFFEGINESSLAIYYSLTGDEDAVKYSIKLSAVKLEITGSDLIQMGFVPSVEFGQTLNEVLKQKLLGNVVSKQDEINFVKRFL